MIVHDSWWSNESARLNYHRVSSTIIDYHAPSDQRFSAMAQVVLHMCMCVSQWNLSKRLSSVDQICETKLKIKHWKLRTFSSIKYLYLWWKKYFGLKSVPDREKDILRLVTSVEVRKKFWVSIRNRSSDLPILRCDAVPMNHRDSQLHSEWGPLRMWRAISLLIFAIVRKSQS